MPESEAMKDIELVKEKINKMCEKWNRKTLARWERTSDKKRWKYNLEFGKILFLPPLGKGSLVFKEGIGKQQAEEVIDPIIQKLEKAHKEKSCPSLMTMDYVEVLNILDMPETKKANQ